MISAFVRPANTISVLLLVVGKTDRAAGGLKQIGPRILGFQNSGASAGPIHPRSTAHTKPFFPSTAVSYPLERTQPVVLGEFCDDLLDDGISEIFLAIEMVVERSLGDIGGSQNRIDAGTPKSRSVDFPKTCLQQAFSRLLWITQSSLLISAT